MNKILLLLVTHSLGLWEIASSCISRKVHAGFFWRPFIMKSTSDQSVLSSLTKTPPPPAEIIAQVTCQVQPLTLMTGGKHETKICRRTEDQSHESSSVPLPIWHLLNSNSRRGVNYTRCFLKNKAFRWLILRCSLWPTAADSFGTNMEKLISSCTSWVFTYWVVIWDQASSLVAICAELNSWSTCLAPSMHAILLGESPAPAPAPLGSVCWAQR